MTRVGGNDNCADLGTTPLDYQTTNRHLKFVECVLQKAGARLLSSYNSFRRLILTSIETGGSPLRFSRRDQRLELDT